MACSGPTNTQAVYDVSPRQLYGAARCDPEDYSDGGPRWEVDRCRHAVLVSSATKVGHRPVLDIDIPAGLVTNGNGLDLYVDTRSSQRKWKRAMGVLVEAGIARSTPARSLRYDARCWREKNQECLNRQKLFDSLVAVGADTELTFDELFGALRSLDERGSCELGPRMRRARRIPLACDAVLLPSAHNHHLYLELTLSWPTYEKVLDALVQVKVIEPGYVGASIEREMTFVRPPWAAKGSPSDPFRPVGVADII